MPEIGRRSPGQDDPNGSTTVFGVIGSPIEHSLSPAIHNAAFAHLGLNATYVAFDVAPGRAGAALDAVRALNLGGLSVTMPHKEAIAAGVDECTEVAAALGAVNCVFWRDGRLVGDNTDGAGFVAALRHLGFEHGGKRVAIFGAGGAARSIIAALGSKSAALGSESAALGSESAALGSGPAASIAVINRTESSAVMAAAVAPEVASVGDVGAVSNADLIINATSVGMAPNTTDTPYPSGRFTPHQLVIDIVYHPLETQLMRDAQAAGARAVNGVPMLVGQAAVAFQRWTGQPGPFDVMTQAVSQHL